MLLKEPGLIINLSTCITTVNQLVVKDQELELNSLHLDLLSTLVNGRMMITLVRVSFLMKLLAA